MVALYIHARELQVSYLAALLLPLPPPQRVTPIAFLHHHLHLTSTNARQQRRETTSSTWTCLNDIHIGNSVVSTPLRR